MLPRFTEFRLWRYWSVVVLAAGLGGAFTGCQTGGSPAPEKAVAPGEEKIAPGVVPTVDGAFLRLRAGTSAAQAEQVNQLLAALLDSVGLYTILGDLKPMSDIVPGSFRGIRSQQELARLAEAWAAAAGCLESDQLAVHLLWFQAQRGRTGFLFVFRPDLVRQKIQAHPAVFRAEKLTEETSMAELARRLERLEFRDRSRVQGLLYGFPEYAVDFFCRAGRAGEAIGLGKDRKSVIIPTYARPWNFIYVVPIAAALTPEDWAIQAKAAALLEDYRQRRPRYERPDGTLDALRLINDWWREQKTVGRARRRAA